MAGPVTQKPGTFGIQPASAGALAIPVGSPPYWKDTLHWFDFTDQATVFSDLAGVVPIADGVEIQYVENKGHFGDTPAVEGPPNPDWDESVALINGLSVADSAAVQQPITFTPEGLDISLLGMTFAQVVKADDNPPAGYFFWNGSGANSFQMRINFGAWQPTFNGLGLTTNRSVTLGEWVWLLATWEADGSRFVQASGNSEEVGAIEAPAIIPDGSTMTLAGLTGDEGETIIWNRALTSLQRAEVVSYFDTKYGVLPVGP